jgi:Low affinity iron permease
VKAIFSDHHFEICWKERKMIISQHGQTAARPLTFLDRFDHVAKQTEYLTGHPLAFAAASCFVAIWAITGPLFHFGDSWQFTFVSVSSIVTFLMVFLIQNTQNRTRAALQLKLDELIRSTKRRAQCHADTGGSVAGRDRDVPHTL